MTWQSSLGHDPVRPEPKQRAESGADEQGDVVSGEVVAQACQVEDSHAGAVDEEPDRAQAEEQGRIARGLIALGVPERAAPPARVGDRRRQDCGDCDRLADVRAIRAERDELRSRLDFKTEMFVAMARKRVRRQVEDLQNRVEYLAKQDGDLRAQHAERQGPAA